MRSRGGRRDLETDYAAGIDLEWGAPSVSYKETVTAPSDRMCLSGQPPFSAGAPRT